MNYLAHARLSFGEPGLLTGNMISDFVKGKKKFEYPEAIQKGILLHRAIDEFTDHHPVTKIAMEYFRPDYRLYAGAFIDIVYDHFLANDLNEFATPDRLADFSNETYLQLEQEATKLPAKFEQMLPYMKLHNWLYNYRYKEGIQQSFIGLVKRAAYLTESAIAFNIFNEKYHELEKCYRLFYPELKEFANQRRLNLVTA